MRQISLLLLFLFFSLASFSQKGKFAGSMKKLIGIKYSDPRNIPALKGCKFREGSVVGDISSNVLVDVYQKGTTWLVFFSVGEDNDTMMVIEDVLKIKNVGKKGDSKTFYLP